jgi:hypothetical protein
VNTGACPRTKSTTSLQFVSSTANCSSTLQRHACSSIHPSGNAVASMHCAHDRCPHLDDQLSLVLSCNLPWKETVNTVFSISLISLPDLDGGLRSLEDLASCSSVGARCASCPSTEDAACAILGVPAGSASPALSRAVTGAGCLSSRCFTGFLLATCTTQRQHICNTSS